MPASARRSYGSERCWSLDAGWVCAESNTLRAYTECFCPKDSAIFNEMSRSVV